MFNSNPYQQMYQQGYNPYQARYDAYQQMQPQQHYEIVRVNGEAGANMLQLGARSSVLALDESRSDMLIAWFIQTDDAGYKTKTPYILTPYQAVQESNNRSLEERISRLEAILSEQSINADAAATAAAADGSK